MTVAAKAYVTFQAGGGDNWMEGVVGLAKDQSEAGSAYPLVVAVLPDVPELHHRILTSHGCIVRAVAPVYPPENQTQLDMVINYSKLRIWEFVEYERMIYLDADVQMFDSIDDLFDLPKGHVYAVTDGIGDNIGYYPCKVSWPAAEQGPPPALYFNAGMGVLELSTATAKALLDTLPVEKNERRQKMATNFIEKPNMAGDLVEKFNRELRTSGGAQVCAHQVILALCLCALATSAIPLVDADPCNVTPVLTPSASPSAAKSIMQKLLENPAVAAILGAVFSFMCNCCGPAILRRFGILTAPAPAPVALDIEMGQSAPPQQPQQEDVAEEPQEESGADEPHDEAGAEE